MGKENADLDSKFQNGNSEATSNSANITIPNAPSGSNKPKLNNSHERRYGNKEGGCGRGGGRGKGERRGTDGGARHKRGEMGRAEWSRNLVDKRKRNERERAAKRQKIEVEGDGAVASPFTVEEIKEEERRPKRKVAVLIGYAGSGYKGMQINSQGKTIEGDLFAAFVAAGAISKANADDPKKSSLVRCARTDKGVHAAGNVISLKMIIEDPDIVKKVNASLPAQIRVWGFERTNGSFSCYQACDSRWYEYLIPTYSFIPPHPQSFLGKKLVESAEKDDKYESYRARQEDAEGFWDNAEGIYVRPVLERLDPELRAAVMDVIYSPEDDLNSGMGEKSLEGDLKSVGSIQEKHRPSTTALLDTARDITVQPQPSNEAPKFVLSPLEVAIKEVKAAYMKARKAYRISPIRRKMVEGVLSEYVGTQNFHNFTIQKTFHDPSAKRVIRSFEVGYDPIIIGDTEWLSLKIHGQSFMMHQIRKMVGMAALIVRCGCPSERIKESYGPDNICIPKAPGLGLLLERPVFSSYNERALKDYGREKIDFDKFDEEIQEFKRREIYDRIFREEERDSVFHTFFNHIDHFRSDNFLWVTSTGIAAASQPLAKGELASREEGNIDELEDEPDTDGEEG